MRPSPWTFRNQNQVRANFINILDQENAAASSGYVSPWKMCMNCEPRVRHWSLEATNTIICPNRTIWTRLPQREREEACSSAADGGTNMCITFTHLRCFCGLARQNDGNTSLLPTTSQPSQSRSYRHEQWHEHRCFYEKQKKIFSPICSLAAHMWKIKTCAITELTTILVNFVFSNFWI